MYKCNHEENVELKPVVLTVPITSYRDKSLILMGFYTLSFQLFRFTSMLSVPSHESLNTHRKREKENHRRMVTQGRCLAPAGAVAVD